MKGTPEQEEVSEAVRGNGRAFEATNRPDGVRRRSVLAPLLGLLGSVAGCAASVPEAPPNPAPVVLHESADTRVTRLQSGWVAVKRRFREYAGPDAVRLPAILLDRRWTEWMPIAFYLVEHGGRRIVFDTGETARVSDPSWFDCDPLTRWFYTSQLRFAVEPDDELGPALERLGIAPSDVDTVVLSHLHSDHVGGLRHVTAATWFISARDANGHSGALTCRMPEHADTRLVTPDEDPFGAFERSYRLTDDGHVRIVPTPGHSPGHQSLLVRDGDRWVLLGGDVAFDRARLADGRGFAAIVADPAAARRSLDAVEAQLRRFDTLLATAHDGAPHAHRH